MEEQWERAGTQPRRKFLAGVLGSLAGAAALLLVPRRARAARRESEERASGPILYHRTEETERYYKTLYYR